MSPGAELYNTLQTFPIVYHTCESSQDTSHDISFVPYTRFGFDHNLENNGGNTIW